jgi:hypothetical protein
MRTIAACGLVLTLLPGAAAAQADCLNGLTMPAVGSWAEYTGTYRDKPTTMRYAVIGSETREGKDLKWLEMRVIGEQADTQVYQMLTPGTPADIGQVEDVVFKQPKQPAMRMNSMMMGMIRGQLEKNSILTNLCEGVTPAGQETVAVPAGSFQTTKLHNDKYASDAWVSPQVPFYMVKSVGKDFSLSLAQVGSGAHSSITETPQEMPGFGPAKKKTE